jgi:hypothetical protein
MGQESASIAGSTIWMRLAAELRSGHRVPVALLMSLALLVTGMGLSGTALA